MVSCLAIFAVPGRNLVESNDIAPTCGGGDPGNGLCDNGLCCSNYGYCGNSNAHCTNPAPVATCGGGNIGNGVCPNDKCCSTGGNCGYSLEDCGVTLAEAPPDVHHSRMIAYLGNWDGCPSDAQLDQYTHIVIGFAVTYTLDGNSNQVCDQNCKILQPYTCGSEYDVELIQEWRTQGKKVILSFGGAGMGGSWLANGNGCWEHCFGKEDNVVERLTQLVNDMGLDGVDIDYEYFYQDNQNDSGFAKGIEAQTFLREVTVGLRASLPTGSEITHAPMETDLVARTAYYDLLAEAAVSESLDFLMPQYYNGHITPYDDFDEALIHYNGLLDIFGGDATKIVFGFCMNNCNEGFNLDKDKSKAVMNWLSIEHPCNGGAFFWLVRDDIDALWSSTVNQANDAGKCRVDNGSFRLNGRDKRDCKWVGRKLKRGFDICDNVSQGVPVKYSCRLTCGTACGNNEDFRFRNRENKDCFWIENRQNKCDKISKGQVVKYACPLACGSCP